LVASSEGAGAHLEEIDTAMTTLFLGALHSLDAFSDRIFHKRAWEVSWWRGAEDTPFCGAKDLFRDVGGK